MKFVLHLTAIWVLAASAFAQTSAPKTLSESQVVPVARKELESARPDLEIKNVVPHPRFYPAGPGIAGGSKWVIGFQALEKKSRRKGEYFVTVFGDGRPLSIADRLDAAPGFRVYLLPERVAKLGSQRGGFKDDDGRSVRHGEVHDNAQRLLGYYESAAEEIRQNGIWLSTEPPASYLETELAKVRELAALCAEKKIPLYTCPRVEGAWIWKQL